ncbi:D-alanine--D-alanine ligase [Aerococcaceae bacterium DSM 111022]|nr:D-alanine--D-alanine ligase [Aerococcaceae bacterium DSM 111022]
MKVTVLYGGQSAEHDISILSAFNIISSLIRSEYQVDPIYITREGTWLMGQEINNFIEDSELLKLNIEDENVSPVDISRLVEEKNIVFPALHGPNGEDGTIQGFLEVLNLPYVGCGVAASANGMDKIVSKQLFSQADLPQLPYVAFTEHDWKHEQEELIQKCEGSLLYPLFVKPANMGSSVGISRVENEEELINAVNEALRYDRRIVVEQGITADECEVAVLGNSDVNLSVVGRLVKTSDFYDYDEKYINNQVEMEIPANLAPEVATRIQEYAHRAYKAIDGAGLARVDFFVTSNNDIYINEINTMPGFTEFSMYPALWQETGINERDLIEELIQLGLRRYETKQGFEAE